MQKTPAPPRKYQTLADSRPQDNRPGSLCLENPQKDTYVLITFASVAPYRVDGLYVKMYTDDSLKAWMIQ